MRVDHIQLDNIRCYNQLSASFDDGLVLLYGENGAGKSSLLTSIFGGLYMSDVLSYMDDSINLDSLIRKGQEEGSIKLRFSINGNTYDVLWSIEVRDEADGRRASTKTCTLDGSDIDGTVNGVRKVRSRIEDIMGLDAESFVNSVYVQQGEITRMLNTKLEKRKEIIDGLLGLSKLDTYIERMDKARLEIGSQRRRIDELLEEKRRQMKSLDDKSSLQNNIEDSKDKKKQLKNQKETLEQKKQEAREKRNAIDSNIESYTKKQNKYEEAKQSVDSKKQEKQELQDKLEQETLKLETLKKEREELSKSVEEFSGDLDVKCEKEAVKSRIESLRQDADKLRNDITALEKGNLSKLTSKVSRKEDEIDSHKSSIRSLEKEIEDIRSKIEDLQQKKEIKDDKIEDLERLITNKEKQIRDISESFSIQYEEIDELQGGTIQNARENVLENARKIYTELGESQRIRKILQSFIEQKECPVCKSKHKTIDSKIVSRHQKVEEDLADIKSKTNNIKNQKESLDELDTLVKEQKDHTNKLSVLQSDSENIKQSIESKKSLLSDKKSEIQNKNEEINNLEETIQQAEEKIENIRSKIESKKVEHKKHRSRLESLKSLLSKIKRYEDLDNKIESVRSEVENIKNLRQKVQSQYLESKQRLSELEDDIGEFDISEQESNKSKLESNIQKIDEKCEEINKKVEQIQSQIAQYEQKIQRVDNIKQRIDELNSKMSDVSEQEKDAESVMNSYKSVKSKLRRENIGLLNKYANQIFTSVYSNKVYQRLNISSEYDITLVTGDGVEMKPKDLSGGEKTIISLSIRAGVYRLLVERKGNSHTLPPFILDEPTTYLDETHVSNLQSVIDMITSWNVPQVFIVSHRENMIQNADSAYEISKNPTKETSSVSREY